MNALQRGVIGLTVFSLVTGAVSAPIHGEPVTVGLAISVVILTLTFAFGLGCEWVISGKDGVLKQLRKLT